MPSFKKSKSSDALSVIGSVRTGRLNGEPVDPDNFPISYRHARWAIRAAQVVLAIVAIALYTNQSRHEWAVVRSLAVLKGFMIGIASISLLVSPFQAALYFSNFFGKWTSRKVLTIETSIDAFMTFWELLCFSLMMAAGECKVGSSAGCDSYNWAAAWTFFLLLGWGSTLVLDALSWYRSTIIHSRIDDQTELEIRRYRMQQK